MQQVLLTLVVFGLGFAGMAIGVLLQGQRRELKGSCGGVGNNADCCKVCPDKPLCETAQFDETELVALDRPRDAAHLAHSPSGHTAVPALSPKPDSLGP